jgi:murein DD-endopeptidase MepM/ murein hydrolase activator NlpD
MVDRDQHREGRRIPAPGNRRWLASCVLVALVTGSGVTASSDGADAADPAASGPKQVASAQSAADSAVVASFAAISIEELPVLEDEDPGALQADPAVNDLDLDGGMDVSLVSVWRGELARGETLSSDLAAMGISKTVSLLIEEELQLLFDFRHSRPGDRYRLSLDAHENIVDFRYSLSLEESIYLVWDGESYLARYEQAELEARVATLAGRVEGSLYDSIRDQGEDPQLADDFASIFAWDIDFTRNVKSGDMFHLVYERLYLYDDDGEEVYVRPGRIIAARYEGEVGELAVVYFEHEPGHGSYYRPNGSSIEREFLLAPLRYSRISSTFMNARRHPILNITRRHPGIDYAAKEGTTLWAVADGTVTYRGWAGGSGNFVKVRHANGYVSHYAHLSKFAEGLKVGAKVRQKEVIGYVGHTGLATGPHVCFRVTRNGRYVNPLKIQNPPADPIEPGLAADFARVRDGLLSDLGVVTVAATDDAL